jgi:hypothetical protein
MEFSSNGAFIEQANRHPHFLPILQLTLSRRQGTKNIIDSERKHCSQAKSTSFTYIKATQYSTSSGTSKGKGGVQDLLRVTSVPSSNQNLSVILLHCGIF